MNDPICPLCHRPIPQGVPQSNHHLIPKLKGGKGGPVVLMHHICHRQIHATLTESELAREYNTPEALRAHPALAKFAAWVAKRPATFHSKMPGGQRKRCLDTGAAPAECRQKYMRQTDAYYPDTFRPADACGL